MVFIRLEPGAGSAGGALGSPIKTVGKHSATVEVHPDVTATVVLEVVAS